MKLYLARHGEYQIDAIQHIDVLSEQGKKDIHSIANFLRPSNLLVTTIYHSGKLRAQQTAEYLATAIRSEQPLQSRAGLQPLDDINMLCDEVNASAEDMLLVGHLPFMGKLVSQLITGNENKEVVMFNPGTVICLEKIEYNRWLIQWVLHPDLFR